MSETIEDQKFLLSIDEDFHSIMTYGDFLYKSDPNNPDVKACYTRASNIFYDIVRKLITKNEQEKALIRLMSGLIRVEDWDRAFQISEVGQRIFNDLIPARVYVQMAYAQYRKSIGQWNANSLVPVVRNLTVGLEFEPDLFNNSLTSQKTPELQRSFIDQLLHLAEDVTPYQVPKIPKCVLFFLNYYLGKWDEAYGYMHDYSETPIFPDKLRYIKIADTSLKLYDINPQNHYYESVIKFFDQFCQSPALSDKSPFLAYKDSFYHRANLLGGEIGLRLKKYPEAATCYEEHIRLNQLTMNQQTLPIYSSLAKAYFYSNQRELAGKLYGSLIAYADQEGLQLKAETYQLATETMSK